MGTDAISDKLANNRLLDMFENGQVKRAQDAINDYTRIKIREDGFLRRILPPVQITNDELDRAVETDKPVKIIDKEPDSPAAVSVPFGTQPQGRYVEGPKYRVMFQRILTPKFYKDIEELRTYTMDIRQILSDNSIKDVLAEEDGKFIATLDSIMSGANVVLAETGTAQWVTIGGGITRDTLAEAMKTLPKSNKHLNVATVLINNVSIWDVVKMGRDEMGGDLSQELFRSGFAEREIMGVRYIITIKRNLVADNTIYLFSDPKFMGKFFVLEDVTMYIDRRAFLLEFFAYECLGAAVANVAAVGRVDFQN